MENNINDNNEIENDLESSGDEIAPTAAFGQSDIDGDDVPPTAAIEMADIDNGEIVAPVEPPPTVVAPAETLPAAQTVAAQSSGGMSDLVKGLLVVLVILGIGGGLLFWKTKVSGHGMETVHKVSKEEVQLILKDLNPMQLQSLASNPEQKKKVADSIGQLFSIASEAKKEGIADDPNVKQELESIRTIITATLYDKEVNKDKSGAMPPFSLITEDQIKEFWGENQPEPSGFQSAMDKIGLGWIVGGAETRRHAAEFQQFLDAKVAIAKEDGKLPKDQELNDEQIKQAKDDFARIKIYEKEAEEKKNELGEDFKRELELQTKLQQAQFLAGRFVEKNLVDKVKATDAEINQYIAEHPEFDTRTQRDKAQQILSRAQAGEDFAALANEYSEDPGNKGANGEMQGGIYKDVQKGKMVPPFEQAALALEPGNIAPNLVETDFGYHIIKLERKGETNGADGKPTVSYDVRHILIGTTTPDPKNPMARPVPAKQKVRGLVEKDKQKQILDEIVANNPVEVAQDFEVPQPSQEDLDQMQQQMMQQQMMQQMPQGGMPPGMPPPDGKSPNGKMPPPNNKTAPKK